MSIKFTFIDHNGNEDNIPINENIIRDIRIKSMWEGLNYSKLSYKEKINILSKKHHLSSARVGNIIAE